jgi:hypothetical protein
LYFEALARVGEWLERCGGSMGEVRRYRFGDFYAFEREKIASYSEFVTNGESMQRCGRVGEGWDDIVSNDAYALEHAKIYVLASLHPSENDWRGVDEGGVCELEGRGDSLNDFLWS